MKKGVNHSQSVGKTIPDGDDSSCRSPGVEMRLCTGGTARRPVGD